MYTPNKKEIRVLEYLYKVPQRFDGKRKGCIQEDLKAALFLSNDDISDMLDSEFVGFTQISITSGLHTVIYITSQGNRFVENYRYEKVKEVFYWVFGTSSIIAAIFAVLAVSITLCN